MIELSLVLMVPEEELRFTSGALMMLKVAILQGSNLDESVGDLIKLSPGLVKVSMHIISIWNAVQYMMKRKIFGKERRHRHAEAAISC